MKTKSILLWGCVILMTATLSVFGQGFLTFPTDYSPTTKPKCGFSCYFYKTGNPHGANDYSVASGTVVYSAAGGQARAHTNTSEGSYGRIIYIDHGNGYETRYAHLSGYVSRIKDDQAAVRVEQGEPIGYSGNSGGPWLQDDRTKRSPYHLHFEVRKNGATIDPYDPNNYLWSTNPPSFAKTEPPPTPTPALVGLMAPNGSTDNQITPAFQEFYSQYGGQSTFGLPWDNGKTLYVHAWPDGGNLYVQDMIKGSIWCQLVWNRDAMEVFVAWNEILKFWNANWGWRDYGPPISNEEQVMYIGEKIASFGLNITYQRFSPNGSIFKTIVWNGSVASHSPIGVFEFDLPSGYYLEIERSSGQRVRLPRSNPNGTRQKWAIDSGNYVIYAHDANGNYVFGGSLALPITEGNHKLWSPDTPPAPTPDPNPEPDSNPDSTPNPVTPPTPEPPPSGPFPSEVISNGERFSKYPMIIPADLFTPREPLQGTETGIKIGHHGQTASTFCKRLIWVGDCPIWWKIEMKLKAISELQNNVNPIWPEVQLRITGLSGGDCTGRFAVMSHDWQTYTAYVQIHSTGDHYLELTLTDDSIAKQFHSLLFDGLTISLVSQPGSPLSPPGNPPITEINPTGFPLTIYPDQFYLYNLEYSEATGVRLTPAFFHTKTHAPINLPKSGILKLEVEARSLRHLPDNDPAWPAISVQATAFQFSGKNWAGWIIPITSLDFQVFTGYCELSEKGNCDLWLDLTSGTLSIMGHAVFIKKLTLSYVSEIPSVNPDPPPEPQPDPEPPPGPVVPPSLPDTLVADPPAPDLPLVIDPPTPVLSVSPDGFGFQNTTINVFHIINTGTGTLEWEVVDGSDWLDCQPKQGTGDSDITITVDYSMVGYGTHSGYITVRSNGGKKQMLITLTKKEPPPPVNHSPSIIRFSPGPTSGLSPFTISYSVEASDMDGDTLAYLWEFGNGQSSTVVSGVFTYAMPGNYSLKVVVSDNKGGIAEKTQSIDVMKPEPILTFYANQIDFGWQLDSYNSKVHNTGDDTLRWSVAENCPWLTISPLGGTVLSKEEQRITFVADRSILAPGNYSATAIFTSDGGGKEVEVKVTVPYPLILSAEVSPLTGYAPLAINYSASVNGTAVWDFGDSGQSIELVGNYVYRSVGSYQISLTVHNDTLGTDVRRWTVEAWTTPATISTIDVYDGSGPSIRHAGPACSFNNRVNVIDYSPVNYSLVGFQVWIKLEQTSASSSVEINGQVFPVLDWPAGEYQLGEPLSTNYLSVWIAADSGCTALSRVYVVGCLGKRIAEETPAVRVPEFFTLHPPYPNPFNSGIMISYDLPDQSPVTLVIYDIGGREVSVLVDCHQPAGNYLIHWQPVGLSTGPYYCRLTAGHQTQTQKLIYVK